MSKLLTLPEAKLAPDIGADAVTWTSGGAAAFLTKEACVVSVMLVSFDHDAAGQWPVQISKIMYQAGRR